MLITPGSSNGFHKCQQDPVVKPYAGCSSPLAVFTEYYRLLRAGGDSEGGHSPPTTYESNLIHHDFVEFGKQHSRYNAILSSIVLSQQCCEVYFISLTVMKPL